MNTQHLNVFSAICPYKWLKWQILSHSLQTVIILHHRPVVDGLTEPCKVPTARVTRSTDHIIHLYVPTKGTWNIEFFQVSRNALKNFQAWEQPSGECSLRAKVCTQESWQQDADLSQGLQTGSSQTGSVPMSLFSAKSPKAGRNV